MSPMLAGRVDVRSLYAVSRIVAAAIFLISCASRHSDAARVQRATSQAPDPAASQPGQEIQRLTSALAGRWSIRQTIEPRDGMPKGAEGQGTEVWRPGPGGISLIEDFDTRVGDRQLSGLGIIWWDNQARGYRVTWCGSANPRGCVVMSKLAGWEGGQFVIRDEFERDHKTIVYREVFSDLTPVSFTQTVYQGESGGELKRMTTIRAAKKKNEL